MQFDLVWTLLISLGLTIVLELAFALIFKVRRTYDLILVIVVNIITNPAVVLLNYLLLRHTDIPQLLIVLILEAAAVLVEGIYYKRYAEKVRRPFLFSLGANTFSYFIGLILTKIVF